MFRTVSYSVIRVTPGTGSSITSMIVSSTAATLTTLFGAFLGAFLAAVFSDRFFVAADFKAAPPRRRTLDFAFFVAVRFAALLRAGLALALRRFKAFLRDVTRLLALAMVLSVEIPPARPAKTPTMLTPPPQLTKRAPVKSKRAGVILASDPNKVKSQNRLGRPGRIITPQQSCAPYVKRQFRFTPKAEVRS